MASSDLSTRPLGVLLVGCGAVAREYYAPALSALAREGVLDVRALCDPDPACIVTLQKRFPAAARVEHLAELADVDLAIVASPPRFHAAQTLELLGAGVSVLCEKPLAATLPEAEAMVEAGRAARGVFAVGLFRRFFPATATIRGLLRAGVLGEIRRFSCFEGGRIAWPVRSPTFFERTGLQGGVLLDVGVHLLDLLIWWWGVPLAAQYEDDAMGGVEANCRLRLTFAPGFSGEVRLSRDWALPNRYVIEGTKGWIAWEVNDADGLVLGFAGTGVALNARLHADRWTMDTPSLGGALPTFEQSFANQLMNVTAAVRGAAPLAVPAAEALPSLALIDDCYRRRTPMAMPWLGAAEAVRAAELAGDPAAA